jgi:hypothetical protein
MEKIMEEAPEIETKTLSETDSYSAWKALEPDGEVTYHLQLNNITVHFFEEEWNEFQELIKAID